MKWPTFQHFTHKIRGLGVWPTMFQRIERQMRPYMPHGWASPTERLIKYTGLPSLKMKLRRRDLADRVAEREGGGVAPGAPGVAEADVEDRRGDGGRRRDVAADRVFDVLRRVFEAELLEGLDALARERREAAGIRDAERVDLHGQPRSDGWRCACGHLTERHAHRSDMQTL